MPDNLAAALAFIVNAIAQLYLFVLLLRLLLPWLGADFRNPIAQAILKITSPVVVPLRRVIPPIVASTLQPYWSLSLSSTSR